jgi:hypothetical protein
MTIIFIVFRWELRGHEINTGVIFYGGVIQKTAGYVGPKIIFLFNFWIGREF